MLATKHKHFETRVQARNFLENEFCAWGKSFQDCCHDTPKEYRVLARQHPNVVALELAGVNKKKEIEQKKHPFVNSRLFEVKPKENAMKAERASTAAGAALNGRPLECYACTGAGRRLKKCPSTNPFIKNDGQRCCRQGGIGH